MTADFVEPKPLHKAPYKSGRDILESQYRGGRAVIDRNDWARTAFEDLRRRCEHVPEEDLVRLFHDRSQSQLELIAGGAVFREYNATRPLGRKRTKAKARPASKVVLQTVESPAAKPSAPRGAKPHGAKPAARKPAVSRGKPAPKAKAKRAPPRKAAAKAKPRRR